MNKTGPELSAPPSYEEATRGVQPSSPYTQHHASLGPSIVTTVVPLGAQSTHTVCPTCNMEIYTAVRKEPSLVAFISGGLLFLLGCCFGCCLIPCCIPECFDKHHSCPNCKSYLGRFTEF